MALAKLQVPRHELTKAMEEAGLDRQAPRDILEKARAEMDRTIDRQVEPYRQKIRELERRRSDIDEELKGLYMIVGFYDSVRMQAIEGRG
jgi:phosphoenolpyruvate carboxylase